MRKAIKGKSPSLRIERFYWEAGNETIAGQMKSVKVRGQDRLQLLH